jgi:hypothetical protein
MRGYKLLLRLDEETWASPYACGLWTVYYRPGETARASVGELFFFPYLADAIDWRRHLMAHYEDKELDKRVDIWEVEAEGLGTPRCGVSGNSDDWYDFWRYGRFPHENSIVLQSAVYTTPALTPRRRLAEEEISG